MNTAYRMFPESAAALGIKDEAVQPPPSPDQIALAELLRGFHI
jgi:hypothetical protein